MQSIQCGGSSFPLDISELPSLLYVHDEHSYHWNFLKGHLEHYDIHLTCVWLIRGDIPSWPTFPFVIYSWNSELNTPTTIYLSSDHPTFSAKAQGPIYNLGPYPYTTYDLLWKCCRYNIFLVKILRHFVAVIIFFHNY